MLSKYLVRVIFIQIYVCTYMTTILYVSSFEDNNLIKCLTSPASVGNTSSLSVDVSMVENALKLKVISQKENGYFLSCARLNINGTWFSNSRDLTCPKENDKTLSLNATYLEGIGGIFYIEAVTVNGSSRKQCMIDNQDETTSQIILRSIGVTTKSPTIQNQTQLNPAFVVIPIIIVLVAAGVIGFMYIRKKHTAKDKKIPLIETVRTILSKCKHEEQRKNFSSEHAEVDRLEERIKSNKDLQEDDSLAAEGENFFE